MYTYNFQKASPCVNLEGTEVKAPAVLSLNFLLTHRLPVWVINNTRPKGMVILQMTMPTGRTKPVKMERSILPVNITDEVGQEMVESGGQDLRTYINRGILSLVWPTDALGMINTPEAQEELRRMRSSEFSANNTFVSQRVTDLGNIENAPMVDSSLQAGSILASELSPRVLDFVARFNSDDVQVKDAVSELKVMEDEVTDKDLSYVIANIKAGKAKTYAQKLLAQRQGAPASAKKKAASAEDWDMRKGDDDLTPEEKAEETKREAAARANQRL